MSELVLTPQQARQIEKAGVSAYPSECCGLLIGREAGGAGGRRMVDELTALRNSFAEGERHHRFALDPMELAEADRRAGERGKLVLGLYHSHPDHPARPSEYDREHAWPFYSYVIVSIARGVAVDLTSWQLDEATGTFRREEILELE